LTPRSARFLAALSLSVTLVACGGGGGAQPPQPSPPPELFDVDLIVFYDQNGNGLQDGNEHAVVPGATVQILNRSAETGAGGAATIQVAAGEWTASIKGLPPYYKAGPPLAVTVPVADGKPLRLPATLPIGMNQPAVYMAFGDSITEGDGSRDDNGYRKRLQTKLGKWFGEATVVNQGVGGTRSNYGADRVRRSLMRNDPAYILILYGTNDWNDSACRNAFPCFTINSLRTMVRAAKNANTLPIVSTIIPTNTGFDARTPPSRNEWVHAMNDLIVAMAQQEGAVVADNYAAFMAVPDFHTLFSDHVHPNDTGYDIMTNVFFGAITEQPAEEASARGLEPLFLPPPGAFPETVPPDPADVPRAPRWDAADEDTH
jgi:lysophospholipase L1-like esterase